MILLVEALGGIDEAQRYLRTPNFALGGQIPLNLLTTPEGEDSVLRELMAHAEGGPV